jgi:hypothetical protein
MKAIGNGQQNRTLEKSISFRKHSPMQSGQLNFIKDLQLLRKIRVGFDIFFADGHTDKQMIPHIK